MILAYITGALALGGATYYLLSLVAALRFHFEAKTRSDHTPPVSILKPVKGADADSEACFRSHFEIDYLEYELIFGVASKDDPAVAIIEKLSGEYPQRKAKLVIC